MIKCHLKPAEHYLQEAHRVVLAAIFIYRAPGCSRGQYSAMSSRYILPLIIHHRKKCVTCEAGAADLGTGRHTRDSPDRPKRIDRSADHGLEF